MLMCHGVQIVNAKEYVRRPEKLGLGATPAAMMPKPKKYIRQVTLQMHKPSLHMTSVVYTSIICNSVHLAGNFASLLTLTHILQASPKCRRCLCVGSCVLSAANTSALACGLWRVASEASAEPFETPLGEGQMLMKLEMTRSGGEQRGQEGHDLCGRGWSPEAREG